MTQHVTFREPTALEKAERVARHAHRDQIEEITGDPYIKHVERVVALVAMAGHGADAQAVAWLHDVIEDTIWSRHLLIERARIPREIADAVQVLSRNEGETYHECIARLRASGNPLALAVKLADLEDHLRPNVPPTLRRRYERARDLLATGRDRSV